MNIHINSHSGSGTALTHWVMSLRNAATNTPKTFIEGLNIEFVSTTSFKAKTGSAYVESVGNSVELPTDTTISPSLSASAFHYVYLKNDGTVVASTTAPDAPYFGSACSKASDSTQRYLGSFLTDGSSHIINFKMRAFNQTGRVHYYAATDAAPFRCLSAGGSTSETSVDLSGVIPSTSQAAALQIYNTGSGSGEFSNADTGLTGGVGNSALVGTGTGVPWTMTIDDFPLTSSRTMTYWAGSGAAIYIDVLGYTFER